jgi:hypothetical protein
MAPWRDSRRKAELSQGAGFLDIGRDDEEHVSFQRFECFDV